MPGTSCSDEASAAGPPGNDAGYTPIPAVIGHSAAAMITSGNRKASRHGPGAPSGSPSGWPAIEPRSILEVGCGYGKLLREIRKRLDVPLVGIDFSPTQLQQARDYLGPAATMSACSWAAANACRSPTIPSTWS